MNDIAIKVENLSKKYHIGRRRQRHDTLRDALVAGVRAPLERLRNGGRSSHDKEDTIWALKDVSFEVKRGEVVGVIGRNGAGKSTLLKILTQITEPTSGRAVINGRVGSLLEVGTGFHQELTGRENIYLSGAILGMRREEIDRKFDEIVDFSGVEKFIDTPVKRYSSGMKVRLGFAVAAHLDPEILLVDEVLAVGDAMFQKRCLGKMEGIAKVGRTVLFVSHNMTAIANLCERTILIESGSVVYDGIAQKGIEHYLEYTDRQSNRSLQNQLRSLPENAAFELLSFTVRQEQREEPPFITNEPIIVHLEYQIKEHVHGLRIGFDLKTKDNGMILFRTFHDDSYTEPSETPPGHYTSKTTIPANLLSARNYIVELAIGIHNVRWLIHNEIYFEFDTVNVNGVNANYADRRPGLLMPNLTWEISVLS